MDYTGAVSEREADILHSELANRHTESAVDMTIRVRGRNEC